jgi:ATP-dependent Clp protease adapter protein ClpS
MEEVSTIERTDIDNVFGQPFKVVLFNDDGHSMDEVCMQIMKAINCDVDKAQKIMLEAHNTGRAVVITAHKEKCEHVAAVLEEIRLGCKVEPL